MNCAGCSNLINKDIPLSCGRCNIPWCENEYKLAVFEQGCSVCSPNQWELQSKFVVLYNATFTDHERNRINVRVHNPQAFSSIAAAKDGAISGLICALNEYCNSSSLLIRLKVAAATEVQLLDQNHQRGTKRLVHVGDVEDGHCFARLTICVLAVKV